MFRFKKIILFWFVLILISIFITAIFSNKKSNDNDSIERKIIIECSGFSREMSMEEFIPFVIMAQLPIDSPEELLKAQSVVVRTYILKTMGDETEITSSKLKLPFILPEQLKEIWFEQYKLKNAATLKGAIANFTNIGSSSIYEQNIRKLHNIISETKSQVIKWQGNLILPLYHSVSNGKTRSGEENLGANFKYLKSVDCYGSDEIEGNKRRVTLTVSQIQERIRKKGIILYSKKTELFQGDKATAEKFLEVTDISNIDSSGYVISVKIGDTVVSGSDFADALGLKSSCFEMKSTGESIVFETSGSGHGFGMSLSYAKQLAIDNYKWKKILKTFFEGEICIY